MNFLLHEMEEMKIKREKGNERDDDENGEICMKSHLREMDGQAWRVLPSSSFRLLLLSLFFLPFP